MTMHILHPHGDDDKCVRGVRLSDNPNRRAIGHPREMTGNGCETCYLRTLRTWQLIDSEITVMPSYWTCWPWDDPRYTPPETA